MGIFKYVGCIVCSAFLVLVSGVTGCGSDSESSSTQSATSKWEASQPMASTIILRRSISTGSYEIHYSREYLHITSQNAASFANRSFQALQKEVQNRDPSDPQNGQWYFLNEGEESAENTADFIETGFRPYAWWNYSLKPAYYNYAWYYYTSYWVAPTQVGPYVYFFYYF